MPKLSPPSSETLRSLRLESVTKRFGAFTAVREIDLDVPQGAFFALLGPSGCGKTTTLRMIAGFERPTSGRILIGDTDVTGVKPYRRPVNTVFQSYALFPHLTVQENVAFGLRRRGAAEWGARVAAMLELVELVGHGDKRPSRLSGGQQQRVALARALINEPEVLLLDEPLGALDLKLRRQMQIELKRIQTDVGLTFVHVTHDQDEAMTMADVIAVMNGGVIEQMGTPAELYDHPRTTFVANFLGRSNLLAADVVGTEGARVVVDVRGMRLTADRSRAGAEAGRVWVGVRPEKVALTQGPAEGPADHNTLAGGVVSDVGFIGVSTEYQVRMPWGQELSVFAQNTGSQELLEPGSAVALHWAPAHTFVLPRESEADTGEPTTSDATS
jgi:spermidine/putrescine transport system ATP-binding protein